MIHLEDKKDWNQFKVITETGICLGWVKSTSITVADDTLLMLVVVPSPTGWLFEKLFGAYELLARVGLVYVDLKCLRGFKVFNCR